MLRSHLHSNNRLAVFAAFAVLATTVSATAFAQAPATTVGSVSSAEGSSNDSTHAPAPAPTSKPGPAPAKAPAAVDINFGTMKIGGLIQAWYSDGTGAADNSFRLRRAELKIVGQIDAHVSWTLQLDAAKALSVNSTYVVVDGKKVLAEQSVSQSSRLLQDAFVALTPGKSGLRVSIGQFKIPFTNEGSNAPSKIETVEQPMYISDRARGGGLANVRDLGAMLQQTPVKFLDYSIAVFNGSGDTQNSVDQNDEKALIGRVVVRPFKQGLQLGMSGVMGGHPSADRVRRDRAAGEVQFTNKKVTLRTEYISALDGALHRAGYYAHAAYKLHPRYEALLRYDSWDPDVNNESKSASASAHELMIGGTHFIAGNNAKIQLNVARRSYAHNLIPRVSTLLVNVQTAW